MPQGTLKQMFRGMLADARKAPGRPIVRAAGVFILEITQLESGQVQLSLSRLNTAPTSDDWARFLAQWPEAIAEDVIPSARKAGRRHALVGHWPRPAEITEQAA